MLVATLVSYLLAPYFAHVPDTSRIDEISSSRS